jgi:DNA-binding SARP family transcriptional activator
MLERTVGQFADRPLSGRAAPGRCRAGCTHEQCGEARMTSMEFRVLGPLEVRRDGEPLQLAPAQGALLAALLLHANQVVPTDRLVELIWGDRAANAARNTLQVLIRRLRGGLQPGGARRVLLTRPPGYLLVIGPGQLDLESFETLVARARQAEATGNLEAAAGYLRAALGLWRGRALAGVPAVGLQRVHAPRLEEHRVEVLGERVEVDLRLGRHGGLVGELRALVAEYPLQERFHAQLMLALYRMGRQAEALAAYRDARAVLVAEAGVEPGSQLRALERAVLTADPLLELPAVRPAQAPASRSIVTPCQLPPDVPDFTGRNEELTTLHGLLDREPDRRMIALTVVAITGRAGVGKTALALHVAHQLRSCFPDGQLYVDLRGADGKPVAPATVLAGLLRAFAADGRRPPAGLEERARLYRAFLADRAVLVLLDNAAEEAQVRSLLPGGSTCAVLITSRRRLLGLEGAHHVTVDVLPAAEAIELLGKVAGGEHVAAEPEAAAAVARLCGYLPVALRVAGARVAAGTPGNLMDLAERLGDERRRLDELHAGDLVVRSILALGLDSQRPEEQRAFRLLGALDLPDVAPWAVAALLDVDLYAAERLLDRLAGAHLLDLRTPHRDARQSRYGFHDLLRLLAREQAEAEPLNERQAAVTRVLCAYAGLGRQAGTLVGQSGLHKPWPGPAQPWSGTDQMAARPAAGDPAAWLAGERANLMLLLGRARQAGEHRLSVDLAASLAVLERAGCATKRATSLQEEVG